MISQNLYSIFISSGTYEKDETCFENKETLLTLDVWKLPYYFLNSLKCSEMIH